MDGKNNSLWDKRINKFLYFAVIVVNITSFASGTAFAWSSPVAPKLGDSPENPLGYSLTDAEISWMVSLLSLGAVLGPFIGGYCADKIGRRKTFIVTSVPMILTYILLAFGHNLYLYYVARFITGLCIGIFQTVVPMYVGEVAEIHNRGILGCCTVFFITIGNLYGFAIGPYISVQWFSISCAIFPITFLVIFTLLVPESPVYLIMKDQDAEARKSLIKYRLGSIEDELKDITIIVKESLAASGGIFDVFKTKYLLNSLMVSMGLMFIIQSTAISVIIFYMQIIFESAGSEMPSEVSVMIIGVVQVIGTFASVVVVDKYGRRPLLLISSITTTVTLSTLSAYFYLLAYEFNISSISWLPIAALIVHMFFYNIGVGPLPFTVMGEIFPPHVKSAASSVSVGCGYVFSFVAAQLFPYLAGLVGNWFGFLVFAVCNAAGVCFIWMRVPETKGKTLAEILECFK